MRELSEKEMDGIGGGYSRGGYGSILSSAQMPWDGPDPSTVTFGTPLGQPTYVIPDIAPGWGFF